MEAYREQTREAIGRVLDGKLSFPDCIAALDAALADLIPRLTPKLIVPLRALMLANNEIVVKEMERRAHHRRLVLHMRPPCSVNPRERTAGAGWTDLVRWPGMPRVRPDSWHCRH